MISRSKLIVMGIIGLAALVAILILNPFRIIGPGHRGVVVNFGEVQPVVLGEGLHVIIPIMQRVVSADVRVQKLQTEAMAASRDLQNVHSVVALNFHMDPRWANWLYQRVGTDYQSRIIEPTLQEAVKAVTANHTAEELITRRDDVSRSIREQLTRMLASNHILVDGFSVMNFEFSKDFSNAIEAKQAAEQRALKASRDLDRIKIEAEQKIASAQAEAESLRLQKQEVTPELLRLRETENQKLAIEKWNGILPNVTGGAVPFINVAADRK